MGVAEKAVERIEFRQEQADELILENKNNVVEFIDNPLANAALCAEFGVFDLELE